MDWQVDMERGVRLCTSVLQVDEPHRHEKLSVQYQVLLVERMEVNHLLIPEADDHLIKLE